MDVSVIEFDAGMDNDRRNARPRIAPPMTPNTLPAIADADRLTYGDEYVYDERPAPVETTITPDQYNEDDLCWAAGLGIRRAIRTREGATFTRIAEDVFVISVMGGQYLHDDRHLADITGEAAAGLNEHSWYLVALPSEDQMLIVEVANGIYEHMPFRDGGLLYMNTVNRHLVSRRSPHDMVVLVQACGYGPDEQEGALDRINAVLASRPDPIAE